MTVLIFNPKADKEEITNVLHLQRLISTCLSHICSFQESTTLISKPDKLHSLGCSAQNNQLNMQTGVSKATDYQVTL